MTQEEETADLAARIGYQVKRTQALLRARMDEALRPLGLITPQYSCLELLRHNPGASNSDLARAAFVTRQTMNTLLRGLEDRGLVERSPAAGRVRPTVLTAEGARLVATADRRVAEIERRMISRLAPDQVGPLQLALDRCIEALDSEAPDPGEPDPGEPGPGRSRTGKSRTGE